MAMLQRRRLLIFTLLIFIVSISYLSFRERTWSTEESSTFQQRSLNEEIRAVVKKNDTVTVKSDSSKDLKDNNKHLHRREMTWHKRYEDKRIELVSEQIPVLIIGCSRTSISRAIDSVIKYRGEGKQDKYPIYVSLDCNVNDVERVVQGYGDLVKYWKADSSSLVAGKVPADKMHMAGYYKLSAHYKFALNKIFALANVNQVIILEDDMEVAPDFFSYFEETLPLLYIDPTLLCISSWNDQGKNAAVNNPVKLMRTDFFPGLGWLLTRKLYEELEPIWPEAYWDDWLRFPERRKGRACIIPEVSRTLNFGKVGVSNGAYFDEHISKIAHTDEKNAVDFSQYRDYLHFLVQPIYDGLFEWQVYHHSPVVTSLPPSKATLEQLEDPTAELSIQSIDTHLANLLINPTVISLSSPSSSSSTEHTEFLPSLRLEYHDAREYEHLTSQFSLMTDVRMRVPRSAYHGTVQFVWKSSFLVYIAPATGFNSDHERIFKD